MSNGIAVVVPIPDGTEWQDATGRTWTANGDDLLYGAGAIQGTLTVYQVRF